MKRKVIVPILAILFVVAVATLFLFIKEKESINNNPTPVPTVTEVPEETPTAEPTKEPTVTPTEVPVVEPTAAPTEAPVKVPTETPGCEHKEVVTFLAEETMEEYKYQEICSACNEVVKEYTMTKEPVPTVTPTSTPTPLPTATPTPTPTSTPTPKVECKHEETGIAMVDETDTEYVYRETCDACNEVISEFTKPKVTPTPTPKATEKPVATPTPVPDKVVVKEEELKYSTCITYADRTVASIFNDEYLENYLSFLPANATPLSYVAHYEDINTLVSEEIIARYVDVYSNEKRGIAQTTITCYFYYYYDAKTKTWTSRLVNSDGSCNKYSGEVINGMATLSEGSDYTGFHVGLIGAGSYNAVFEIHENDFIYHEDNVVNLFDY